MNNAAFKYKDATIQACLGQEGLSTSRRSRQYGEAMLALEITLDRILEADKVCTGWRAVYEYRKGIFMVWIKLVPKGQLLGFGGVIGS